MRITFSARHLIPAVFMDRSVRMVRFALETPTTDTLETARYTPDGRAALSYWARGAGTRSVIPVREGECVGFRRVSTLFPRDVMQGFVRMKDGKIWFGEEELPVPAVLGFTTPVSEVSIRPSLRLISEVSLRRMTERVH